MKFLFGRIKRALCIAGAMLVMTAAAASADSEIRFDITSADCGGEQVLSSAADAVLTASADGVNAEKIRWDTDPAHNFPRMQGKKLKNGWAKGGYWLVEFSSEGMESMTFSAQMYSSGKGPGNFELYGSNDGESYVKIENSKVMLGQVPSAVYENFRLPDTLCGKSKVYLKIMIADEFSVKGGLITGLKDGSTYINNIVISGTAGDNPPLPEESPKKQYYEKRYNPRISLMGTQTGKYRFSVPAVK